MVLKLFRKKEKHAPRPASGDTRNGNNTPEKDAHEELRGYVRKGLDQIFAGDADPAPETILDLNNIPERRLDAIMGIVGQMQRLGAAYEKFKSLNDPMASMERIAQSVASDPIFSAKVLKTANSPYFGLPGKVTSVSHALAILGLVNLKTLYFQEHFKILGTGNQKIQAVQRHVWEHATHTAISASFLAKAFDVKDRETAFTIGLLHDVGKLVLINLGLGQDIRQALAAIYTSGGSMALENKLLGVNHALAGRIAANKWELPSLIIQTTALHHSLPSLSATDSTMDPDVRGHLIVLFLADQVAKLFCAKDHGSYPVTSLPPQYLPHVSLKRVKKALFHSQLFQEIEKARAVSI